MMDGDFYEETLTTVQRAEDIDCVELYRLIYYNDMDAMKEFLSGSFNIVDVTFGIRTDNLCTCVDAFETLAPCSVESSDLPFSRFSTVSLEVVGTPLPLSNISETTDYTIDELEALRRNSFEDLHCNFDRFNDGDYPSDESSSTIESEHSEDFSWNTHSSDDGGFQRVPAHMPRLMLDPQDGSDSVSIDEDFDTDIASSICSGTLPDLSRHQSPTEPFDIQCQKFLDAGCDKGDDVDVIKDISYLSIVEKGIGGDETKRGEQDGFCSPEGDSGLSIPDTEATLNAEYPVIAQIEWLRRGHCPHIASLLSQSIDTPNTSESDSQTFSELTCVNSKQSGCHYGDIIMSYKMTEMTSLHLAAAMGHVELVQLLLQHNFDIDATTKETENTPVHLAAMNNKPSVVDLLLSSGCNYSKTNANGDTPMHIAVDRDNKECVSVFIKYGICFKVLNQITQQTPLICAILHNNEAMVSILLEAGGKKMVSERDVASGWSPLHQAACTGSRDCLELLLNNGADPNDTNDDGETPLHLAASNGFDDCVKSLVSNGAVCKPANSWIVGDNQTPLMLAVYHNYPKVVRILLPHDDVTQSSEYGDTVLHYATYRGCFEVVERLLASGADANAQNCFGATPLWYSVAHLDILKILIKHKADLTVSSKGHDLDNMGMPMYKSSLTAFEISLQEGYFESAEFLLRAGCPVKPHCWLITGKIPRRFSGLEYDDVIASLSSLASSATPLKRLRRRRVRDPECAPGDTSDI